MKQDKIVELYRGELWECQLLESILKDNNIDCFLTNSTRSGYGPIVTPAQLIQIMIKESDTIKGTETVQAKQSRIKYQL